MEVKKSAIIPVLILMLFSWSVSSDIYSEFGVTNIKVSKLTLQYTWMINDFKLLSSLNNDSFFINSPVFWPSGNESFKWYLTLYPARSSISLYLENKGDHAITVDFTFSIGSNKKNTLHKFTKKNDWDGWRIFLSRTETLNSCLPNGTLIINCVINTLPEIIISSGVNVDQYTPIKSQVNKSKLPEELLTLLEDEKFSDITIVIDDNEIRAHKTILALRSPVFASLLMKNGTTVNCNGNSSTIEVKDVKPKIFKKLLQYIYTDKVDGIDGAIAKELLVAAIKYDIKGLKVICEEILYNGISIDNAIEILDIADQYHIPFLKSRAMKFASEHAIILKHSSAFKTLEHSKPHLMHEVLGVITPCQCNVQST